MDNMDTIIEFLSKSIIIIGIVCLITSIITAIIHFIIEEFEWYKNKEERNDK